MHLGVVNAECLDFDYDMARQGFGLRQVLVDQAVRSAEFLDNNGTHDDSPEDGQQFLPTTAELRQRAAWSHIPVVTN